MPAHIYFSNTALHALLTHTHGSHTYQSKSVMPKKVEGDVLSGVIGAVSGTISLSLSHTHTCYTSSCHPRHPKPLKDSKA